MCLLCQARSTLQPLGRPLAATLEWPGWGSVTHPDLGCSLHSSGSGLRALIVGVCVFPAQLLTDSTCALLQAVPLPHMCFVVGAAWWGRPVGPPPALLGSDVLCPPPPQALCTSSGSYCPTMHWALQALSCSSGACSARMSPTWSSARWRQGHAASALCRKQWPLTSRRYWGAGK